MPNYERIGRVDIVSNYHWRDLLCGHDLPELARSEFDYCLKPIDDDDDNQDGIDGWYSPRFFHYRGWWYDVNEFQSLHNRFHCQVARDDPMHAWQGYQSDSFFSGILVRYDEQCERI